MSHHHTRVVITGMGLVSPLGASVNAAWTNLLAARSGIRALDADMIGEVTSRIAGVVPSASEPDGFDESRVITSKDAKKVDRFITLALAAAAEAVEQAQWKPETEEQRARTATVIASSMGGFLNISDAVRTTYDAGPRRLSPFTVPSFLPNMAAGWVSIRHGFKGPLGAPGTACAASLQAIGDAARIIRAVKPMWRCVVVPRRRSTSWASARLPQRVHSPRHSMTAPLRHHVRSIPNAMAS